MSDPKNIRQAVPFNSRPAPPTGPNKPASTNKPTYYATAAMSPNVEKKVAYAQLVKQNPPTPPRGYEMPASEYRRLMEAYGTTPGTTPMYEAEETPKKRKGRKATRKTRRRNRK